MSSIYSSICSVLFSTCTISFIFATQEHRLTSLHLYIYIYLYSVHAMQSCPYWIHDSIELCCLNLQTQTVQYIFNFFCIRCRCTILFFCTNFSNDNMGVCVCMFFFSSILCVNLVYRPIEWNETFLCVCVCPSSFTAHSFCVCFWNLLIL